MYFHIILTKRCNSRCKYCYEKSMADCGEKINKKFKFDFQMPEKASYSVEELKRFISLDKNPVLTFYGGEPLLEIEKIKNIMDNIRARYIVQTNGLLLDKIPSEYVNKFDKILVSIDGNKEITDFNRGIGTYDKLIENISLIRKNGFKGELIARMTLSSSGAYNNIYENVKHLVEIGFNSIHWQIDAGFYEDDWKNNEKEIRQFFNEYTDKIIKLSKFWIDEMNNGRVLKLYPLLGIFDSLSNGKKFQLRCGSGYSNYTISPDGAISVCPIMFDMKDFFVGNIKTSNPNKLKKIYVKNFCLDCDILNICGGRCLYSNYAELWPVDGQKLICDSVRNLIDSVKEIIPEIKKLIKQGKISERDFSYEEFSGPEIIP